MAKEIDGKLVTKLAGIVKKNPGNSERWYSEQSGIEMGQILRYLVKAELEANPSLKIPATPASVAKARDEQGLRWPRIAAYAGISESKAKELYEEKKGAGAASTSYTGRGRNWAGTPGTKRSGSGNTAGTSGRRGAAKKSAAKKTGTSGRRGAKSGAAKKTTAAAGRGATRAQARRGADPK